MSLIGKDVHIRVLDSEDVACFQAVRLCGLQETPDAFAISTEEFKQEPLEQLARQIAPEGNPLERFVLGAFDSQENLLGVVGFFRQRRLKLRHRAFVWGMYVLPGARRRGIGRALLQELLMRARTLGDLEQVELEVVTTNVAARDLYLAQGFRVYALTRRGLKMDGCYFDEEFMALSLLEKDEVAPARL
jgi:ribosomal protein S18 acetylase RimI-like enzyme